MPLLATASPWRTPYRPADWGFAKLNQRQLFWLQQCKKNRAYPVEFLLPRITVTYRNEMPESMRRADKAYEKHPVMLGELLDHEWGYYFYLGRGHSTRDREGNTVRARALSFLRFQMINDTVAAILGEELRDCSLIDFACNWGGFAIDMAARGCKDCVGFDIRAENVAKAEALARYLEIGNVSFHRCDVYDVAERFHHSFDIVYNLGLLYHVTDPFSLMRLTYETCRKMAVVETLAAREPFSGFLNNVVAAAPSPEHARGVYALELRPTYRALIDLMHAVGFQDLIEVTAELGQTYPPGLARNEYSHHRRRVIIGFKP